MTAAYRAELVIPRWVEWNDRSCLSDLDRDGLDERVALSGRTLVVTKRDESELYRSPAAWKVSDLQVGDVDRDGLPDLVALVWRRGNYGSSRPFWDKDTDLRMTEHLYVMSLRNGIITPTFMSHELGAPVAGILCEDGGTVVLTTTDGSETRWVWEGFGLVLQED
jgi:hypothetical protein